MTTQRHIKLLDTTLRDGEQTQGVSFAPAEKVSIAQALLSKLNVDRIEVASAGVSSGEKQAVRKINEWASKHGLQDKVEVLGFVDGQRSVDWVCDTNGKVINLLTKGSEKHCLQQLRQSHEEHLSAIKKTIDYAHSQGLSVNVYLEDWSNGYRDNVDYVFEHIRGLQDCGINHFMLPDTLGVMSPAEVYDSLSVMVTEFPDLAFDFHPHNDYGLATANVMSAVQAGIDNIHCTINCLGERAGNASLAEVVVVLRDKLDLDVNIDEQYLFDVSQMVESFSGKFVASNAPILGDDVFTQTAGIHADGDKKGQLYVTKLSPERFARKRKYALGKLAGKASLTQNLQELGIDLTEEEQKKVLARIIELGDSKQTITPDDLPFLIADTLEHGHTERLSLVSCDISSNIENKSTVKAKFKLDDKPIEAVGQGNGGFDAFIKALDTALAENTSIDRPRLIDYQVHIPKGGRTNAITESVATWELQNGRKMTTRGVSANQVFAAINAALRVTNFVLSNQH